MAARTKAASLPDGEAEVTILSDRTKQLVRMIIDVLLEEAFAWLDKRAQIQAQAQAVSPPPTEAAPAETPPPG